MYAFNGTLVWIWIWNPAQMKFKFQWAISLNQCVIGRYAILQLLRRCPEGAAKGLDLLLLGGNQYFPRETDEWKDALSAISHLSGWALLEDTNGWVTYHCSLFCSIFILFYAHRPVIFICLLLYQVQIFFNSLQIWNIHGKTRGWIRGQDNINVRDRVEDFGVVYRRRLKFRKLQKKIDEIWWLECLI